MNKIFYIKKIMVLVFVCSFTSLFPMNNNQQDNKQNNKSTAKMEYQFLVYPDETEIKVNGKLPDNVIQMGNSFMIPKGMDPRLIHAILIPKIVDDFGVSLK